MYAVIATRGGFTKTRIPPEDIQNEPLLRRLNLARGNSKWKLTDLMV